jgi:hypothetical protein
MIDLETKILFGILVILFFFSTYKYTIIFLLFWIFIYLFGFFLTSIGMDIDLVKLENSEIYYQEYTGDYAKLFSRLSEFNKIKRKFKLSCNEYSPFGIFYDDPFNVADLNKCRAVVGIIKHPEKFISSLDPNFKNIENKSIQNKNSETNEKELKEYLKNQNFKFTRLLDSQCIQGSYLSMFSVQNSLFIWISKLITEMSNLKFFRRLYLPKWKENKIKVARLNYKKHCGVINIIREGEINLYIPVENEKDFFFHSEKNAPTKNKKKN